MPLPTISASSASNTTQTDALKAALSFQKQKQSRRLALAKDSKPLRKIEGATESEEECEGRLGVVTGTTNSTSTKTARGSNTGRCVGDTTHAIKQGTTGMVCSIRKDVPSGRHEGASTQRSSASLLTTGPTQDPHEASASATSRGIVQDEPKPHNSGAVMILLTTTQATVVVTAALLVAATVGALALWFTLAYDPYSMHNA
jgi:hypothetical protein